MKIMLASGSPRRYDLLRQMEWDVEVRSLPFDEAETVEEAKEKLSALSDQKCKTVFAETDITLLSACQNENLVCAYNALGKGRAAANTIDTASPVIAADTIVVLGNTILGKPSDASDAIRMLRMLSGKAHQVKTAVAVLYQDKTQLRVITTNVHFRTLEESEIKWYVGTGEPMDKAGAYGIQGKGAVLVERIEGSYDNVVGLPLTAVYEMLLSAGAPVKEAPIK